MYMHRHPGADSLRQWGSVELPVVSSPWENALSENADGVTPQRKRKVRNLMPLRVEIYETSWFRVGQ